ncbi:Piwi domain-containing protein [Gautieria morchelliformis]|nr:Piwi domain-containing protein [Gautieria morchelliformis]
MRRGDFRGRGRGADRGGPRGQGRGQDRGRGGVPDDRRGGSPTPRGGDRGGASFRGGDRGGDRGGFHGGDRGGGFHGGDRGGGFRGGDRGGGFRGGDRGGGGFRGGDRGGGGFRGGDRGGGFGGGDRGGGFRGGDRGGRGGYGRGRGGPTGPIIFTPEAPSDVDPKLISDGDQLVKSFSTLKLQDEGDLPLRPGYGKEGKAIKVRANHFSMLKIPKGPIYEYKVSFHPEVKSKRIRRRLLEILEDAPEYEPYKSFTAHDWSEKLVAAKKLPSPDNAPLEVTVKLVDEDEMRPNTNAKAYNITFTFVNEINSDNLDSHLNGSMRSHNIGPLLSALNIILAKYASSLGNGVRVGRDRFFFKSGENLDLGGGLEAWKGFYSSVRPTLNSLLVNVNVCYTAFYKQQNLAYAMEEFEGASYGGLMDKYVEGVRVQPTHLSYRPKKTVRKVSRQSADQMRFSCQELGGMVTVTQYFLKKYQIRLRKPNRLVDLGTREKPNFVPAELCEILPNQPFKGKLSDNHTAAMIRYACNPPADNARSIVHHGLPSLGLTGATSQILNPFGVSVSSEMAVVPARVLDPPQLLYAQNKMAELKKDRASWNLQSRKFFKGQRMSNWGVFVVSSGSRTDFLGPQDAELANLIRAFKESCSTSGMTVGDPSLIRGANISEEQRDSNLLHQKLLTSLQSMKDSSFVLVILSNGDKRVYAAIRRICDIELGIPATCTQSPKIRSEKGQMQYMANVALKINAKLGGVNHALDRVSSKWLSSPVTMLVGMDVTHPGPGSAKGTPSIAGVVASYDPDHCVYPASLRLQESKKEMIDDLSPMMVERLQLFKEKRKRLPDRIVVFRDGVSEGQFITVLREEYPKFLDAFGRVGGAGTPYRPKLTIIICGKRHHTRFYPTTSESGDHLGNPKPGTVVDRGITAIYEFDFFLQAHAGLQGQTRPTHYTVVHDENNFGADAAQCLINYSSYIFARATKAVSLVPPAYYADLVCERGRFYIHDLLNMPSGSTTSGSSSEGEIYRQAQKLWGRGVHNNVSASMFYL